MTINVQGVPDNVAKYIRTFYTVSDDQSKLEEYADQIAYGPDTIFQIGPMVPATSREGVLAWRQKAWDVVATRKHTVGGLFFKAGHGSIDAGIPECMLHGRVEYVKKDGSQSGADWGGHMVFDPASLADGAEPKMKQYRVWITPDA